jgi:hypothetical protein
VLLVGEHGLPLHLSAQVLEEDHQLFVQLTLPLEELLINLALGPFELFLDL